MTSDEFFGNGGPAIARHLSFVARHSSGTRRQRRRVPDDPVFVDAPEEAGRGGGAEGGEVELDAAGRPLQAELQVGEDGMRAAEGRLVAKDCRGQVADDVAAVGPRLGSGAVAPVHLELEPEPRLGGLGEARARGLDGHREALRALEQRGGDLRRRHRRGRIRVRRDVDDEAVALERRVLRGQAPDEVRQRRELRLGRLDLLRLRGRGGEGGRGEKATEREDPFHGVHSSIPVP